MNQINRSHLIFCPTYHEVGSACVTVKFVLSLHPPKHSSFDELTSRFVKHFSDDNLIVRP